MDTKQQKSRKDRVATERMIDLRNVMVTEETDTLIDEYVLTQRKNKRKVKKGEAAVELIKKGLNAEGIQ